jgi:hypothetical protein
VRDYGNTNAAPFASAPAVGPAGDTYFSSTTKTLYVSDGAAWIATSVPTGAAGGDLTGSTYPNPTLRTVGARIKATVLQTIPSAAYTLVNFDTAEVNRGAAWSAGQPTRIVLGVVGTYLVGAQVYFSANATGARSGVIQNKAATVIAGFDVVASASVNSSVNPTTLYNTTDPTDYIYCQVYQGSAAGLNTIPASGVVMWAWRLST